jgi:hypothetical protein
VAQFLEFCGFALIACAIFQNRNPESKSESVPTGSEDAPTNERTPYPSGFQQRAEE